MALRSLKTHLVAAGALLAAAAPASANLLTNGSYEALNIVPSGFYQIFNAGSTGIAGWTVMGGPVQLTPDTYLALKADDGRHWIDLTGIFDYDKGLRSDAVAVSVGTTYDISFSVGNYLPFGRSTVGLSINGGAESLFTNLSLAVTADNPMNWQSFTVQWLADSPTLSLEFRGRANGALSNNAGIGLDAVGVVAASTGPTPVPVPVSGTAGLALAALALLSGQRRHKA
jgi:hypothetical protein